MNDELKKLIGKRCSVDNPNNDEKFSGVCVNISINTDFPVLFMVLCDDGKMSEVTHCYLTFDIDK